MKTLIAAAIVLSASTLFASAETNLYDTNNWYAIRNGATPVFSATGDSMTITNLSYDANTFCYIDPITFIVGQTITVSGTINLSSISGNSGANTVFGIFDSKTETQANIDQIISDNSLTHGINSKDHAEWGVSKLTNSMAGFMSSVSTAWNRNNPNEKSGFLTTNSGGTKIAAYAPEFSSPTQNTDYNFSISLKKTAENVYAGAFSLGDGTTYSFETQTNDKIEKIDVIGFKMPTNSGAATIKNLAIAVAPEPAMFGLLAGTLALVLAGTRRRRR